jgi:hypothetical protein
VPRAYLNPVGGTDVVATAFQSMGFLGADRVTGVVPSGLPPGVYDVIVVNPNRRVGRLEAGFTVTPNAAPIIENISPNFVDTGSSAVPMTIEGSGFDNPTVTADCLAPDGTTHTPPISVVSSTGTEVSVTLDTTPLVQGEVCVIRVTNADGAYFEYSAIGLSNPASNLAPWRPGPEMTVARRAPAVASARATRAARFIYAIGGDDGSAAGAMASVESAAIDVYGEPTAWFAQPVSLPEPRTLANVVTVGRFLYLVGGNVAGAPTNTVLRAQVLNPEDAPEIVDVTARRGENASEGIGRGVWTYRVSAVMADTDPSNPGGETLPSEPLVVTLNRDDTIVLTLIWDPVPGAKAYRVYRSATGTGDLPLGNEVLMAEVPAPADASQPIAYEDVGAPAGAQTPRPLGATGVWMSLPNLDTAREAPGVTAGRDPADPTTWHVYAVGGLDATGAVDSYERLAATIQPDQSHTLAASWAVGASMLSAARSELTAYAVSHSEAPQVAVGTTYIYAAGGRESTNVDVATVAAGGELTWAADRSMGAMRAGYAGVAGAGFLFVFGGAQGVPTDTTQSGEINPTAPPALINWNASERMTVPRYFAGGAIESAFIYVVGGQSTGGPTPTIERTVL